MVIMCEQPYLLPRRADEDGGTLEDFSEEGKQFLEECLIGRSIA